MNIQKLVPWVWAAAVVAGCRDSTAPPDTAARALEVRILTGGTSATVDPDGYTVEVGGTIYLVAVSDTLAIENVAAGVHSVKLAGIAPNCAPLDNNPQPVAITDTTQTAVVTFRVMCHENISTLEISTTTTGSEIDANGYRIVAMGNTGAVLNTSKAVNGRTSYLVRTGVTRVVLQDVAQNCVVTGGQERTVNITQAAVASVAYETVCEATGSIRLTAGTSGVRPDNDGYVVQVRRNNEYSESFTLPSTGVRESSRLRPGNYTVHVWGIALNCDTQFPGIVTVPSGATVSLAIDVKCVEPTDLAYTQGSGMVSAIVATNSTSDGRTTLVAGMAATDPAWSPDGKRIAFTGLRDGNADIYVASANGSNAIRLTADGAADYRPAWSSDGSRIAFVSDRSGNADIYVMMSDGTNQVRITTHDGADIDPDWEPGGTRIAFSRGSAGAGSGIMLMNADGSGATRLTDHALGDTQPDWSPDGSRLVFRRTTASTKSDLFLVNPDGSALTAMSVGNFHVADPDWSPDGRLIAFTEEGTACSPDYTFCPSQVFVTRMVAGPGRVTILPTTWDNVFNPTWRPAR